VCIIGVVGYVPIAQGHVSAIIITARRPFILSTLSMHKHLECYSSSDTTALSEELLAGIFPS